MKNYVFATTYCDFIYDFEVDNIKVLMNKGYHVVVLANCSIPERSRHKSDIENLGIEVIHIPFERNPFSKNTLKNLLRIKECINILNPVAVDCHLAVVGALVRFATRKKKNIKVIYSPHGFFFYKGCPLFNSIIYKTIEYYLARYTDALITINNEDYSNGLSMPLRGKVYLVNGIGVDIYGIINNRSSEYRLREEFSVKEDEIIIISVGELNKNKNHILVLKALYQLKCKGVNNIHYFVCGRGEQDVELTNFAKDVGISDRFHLLGFRSDVIDLDKQADIFVLPSYKEGLSVSTIEAMACGLPILASRIRGNIDLVDEGQGGYLFNPNDSAELVEAIQNVMLNDRINTMGSYNMSKCKKYSLESVHSSMKMIYGEVLDGNKEK